MAASAKTGSVVEPLGPSARSDAPAPLRPLSLTLFGLDWSEHLPVTLSADGIRFEASSFDRSRPFLREHFGRIFPDEAGTPFRQLDDLEAKARYYRLSDVFEFTDRGRTVGVVIGAPVDWSTYYCRTTALLPEYQRRGLGDAWFDLVFGVLGRHGVARIEGDVAPSNLRMLRMLTRNQFHVVGNSLSDRWGALIRVTRFLDARRGELFQRQFCPGFGPRTCGRHGENPQQERREP